MTSLSAWCILALPCACLASEGAQWGGRMHSPLLLFVCLSACCFRASKALFLSDLSQSLQGAPHQSI